MRRHLVHFTGRIKFENVDHFDDQNLSALLVDFGAERKGRRFCRYPHGTGQLHFRATGKGIGIKLQDIIAALGFGARRVFNRRIVGINFHYRLHVAIVNRGQILVDNLFHIFRSEHQASFRCILVRN